MAEQAVRPSSTDASDRSIARWRTVDIVVTAVLGAAFGVVFWAWGLLWAGTGAAFAAFPPGQAFMYGVWLIPAVLAPLVVRKPGAGLFAELIAAIVSALLGSAWGSIVLLYGLLQGAAGGAGGAMGLPYGLRPGGGGGAGYAAFRWRRYGWPQAVLSAALARAMAPFLDL